ncbi:hypothetical protein CBM2589_A90718 [Cupriavidus taiwanensis]|uniref:Uncharacterized protein n=1 Tax=Cupriavidus taiwanensis TaxID=164546 RepID=A0A375CG58_9BURK|nr:hypothetical protein CBM2589_A90718 [Cupriavidus taiwanensis]
MMRPSERCSSPAKPPPATGAEWPAGLPEATWDIPRSCCSMPSMEESVVMGSSWAGGPARWLVWRAAGAVAGLLQACCRRSTASFSPRRVPVAGAGPWPEIRRKTRSIHRIVPLKSGRSLPPCRRSAGGRPAPPAGIDQTTIDSGVRVFSLQRNVSRAVSRADDQGGQPRPCRRAQQRAASGARA